MRSVSRIIISQIAGFLVFLILLGIANLLILSINNDGYTGVVSFLNENLFLILFISLIGLINEIFWSFYFPLNILAPITSAFLGVYIVNFLYKLWLFLNFYVNLNLAIPIDLIYVLVVIFAVVFGYMAILLRHGRPRENWHDRHERKIFERKMEKQHEEFRGNKIDWEKKGEELGKTLKKAGKNLNDILNKKEKKIKRK